MARAFVRSTAAARKGSPTSHGLFKQATQGMGSVLANLNSWIEWVTGDVLPEVLLDALDPTMDLSDHYAPKDTHQMVDSRYAELKKYQGHVYVEVGYNRNGEAPYTIFVHEMPQFYHEPPTRYKFLQTAMDEDTPEILGRIAIGMKARAGT